MDSTAPLASDRQTVGNRHEADVRWHRRMPTYATNSVWRFQSRRYSHGFDVLGFALEPPHPSSYYVIKVLLLVNAKSRYRVDKSKKSKQPLAHNTELRRLCYCPIPTNFFSPVGDMRIPGRRQNHVVTTFQLMNALQDSHWTALRCRMQHAALSLGRCDAD